MPFPKGDYFSLKEKKSWASNFFVFFSIIFLFRLQKELMALMMSTEKSVSAFPESDNFFKWVATIIGK